MSQTTATSQCPMRQMPTYHRYKRTRFWAVVDGDGNLLAVTVYKKGAKAVVTRLSTLTRYALTEQGREALAASNEADAQ